MTRFAALLAALLVSPALADRPVAGGLGGGGARQTAPCVTPEWRAALHARLEALDPGPHARSGAAPTYAFYPQAGTLYRDLFPLNFVDLDPGPGLLDFDCTELTYDGHMGHDTDLRSFTEQEIGVPIFAVLAGTVVDADDGHFDMSTTLDHADETNFVTLSHGGGLFTYYLHMRSGSVAVNVGDDVVPGQQIGLTASSGYSTGPHLHFETFQVGQGTLEPSAGACRPGPSGWATQTPIRRDLYIRDFGFTPGLYSDVADDWPHPYPRAKALTFNDSVVSYWMQGHNLPAGSTWRMRFFRPSGALQYDSGAFAFTWATEDHPWWLSWWWWDIPAMQAIPGAWTVEFRINNEVVVAAPVTVLPEPDPGFNRPPAPVTLAFDPPSPAPDDVLFCRVQTDLVHDDPDYDVVSYRYEWDIDGAPVRDVTSAGQSDAIPAALATPGALVACRVTPTDGVASGTPVDLVVQVAMPPCAYADLADPHGTLNIDDLDAFIAAFLASDPAADCDANSVLNIDDVDCFVASFVAGCM